MFVALTEDYSYISEKINIFISYAPAVLLGQDSGTSVDSAIESRWALKSYLDILDLYEMFGEDWDSRSGTYCLLAGLDCLTDTVTKAEYTEFINNYSANIHNLRN